ncbi:hypothetical protein HFP89_04765 [Wenzhouxiangella sp. XN79A]|uniref:YceD family protein n=1 Tax=Wenzhouxiangella sp. XN79A TaxID=2724193 RepID=UPI00144AD6AA|nr:hypothetical protein [Wenzhouxiangella sp. XN79A]
MTWLKRVEDLLDSPSADETIGFRLRVWNDPQGHVRLDLALDGAVPLTCQRTLDRFLHPIASQSDLTLVESEAELSTLPEDAEPKVCSEGRLQLVDLIEDEVLLQLPVVPVKPDSEPVVQAGDPPFEPEEPSSPFAALEQLKKR